ncbi:MAG: hypothetical protein IPP90_13230, partial [Gemmatimonadaceae bacterium]|nr:hypothetical protein [Gemmatimonadaceae bacterium]
MSDVDSGAQRSWRQRPEFLGALLVGTLALLLSLARVLHEPSWPTDLDQWYFAARAMLQGRNPYDAVGPAREFKWDWPLNYPLSTVLLTMPLTVLSLPAARVAFSTVAGGVLGYALGKDRFQRIGLVFSAAFVIAISRNQWSPFITAAYFAPMAAVFLAAKPNMALAFLASIRSWRPLRRIAGIGLAAVAVSVMVRPSWPLEWLRALGQMEYVVAPIMRPYAWMLALALLKWRRTDARIFLALVCVPQTPSLYDLLPLFVLMRTPRDVSILSLLTHALFLTIVVLGPFPSFDRYAYELGNVATVVIYLPVMLMLLGRPNVSGVDSAFEPAPPPSLRAQFRASLEQMTRFDAMLLLVNVAAVAVLLWMTLTTRRIMKNE